jgi:hypothetical protein
MVQNVLSQTQILKLMAGTEQPGAPALRLNLIYNTDMLPPTLAISPTAQRPSRGYRYGRTSKRGESE